MEADLAIETMGLTKRYRQTVALDRVDLRVPAGAIYALLGRNGAGKTTMMNMLLDFEPPTAGAMRVLGYDPSRRVAELLRHVGYVPAGNPLYSHLRVGELIGLVAGFYPGRWDDALADELLAHSAVRRDQRAGELSRGMRGLVSVALAVGHHPRLVLMDEAFEGLDIVVRQEIMRVLIRLAQEDGATLLITSHEVADLERIASHVGILHEGRLVVQDSLDALKAEAGREASLESIFVKAVGGRPAAAGVEG